MTIATTHALRSVAKSHTRELAVLADVATDAGRAAAPVNLSINGTSLTVPPEVAGAIGDVLQSFAHRRGVVIGQVDTEVTTGQAAKMLGISRTYLCRLIDEGVLSCRYVGTHRRLRLQDVVAYAHERRKERERKLDELSRISAEVGLYDDDF